MKLSAVISPNLIHGPLALFSGSFEQKVRKATGLGYDGVELMVRDPAQIDIIDIESALTRSNLEVPQIVTGELFGADGLCLVTPDEEIARLAARRTKAVIALAARLGAMVNVGRLRGRLDWLGDLSDPWGLAVSKLREMADWAAEFGVKVTIEPINRYETDYIHTAQDAINFVEEIGRPNLGVMLDLFHMNIEDTSIEDSLAETMECGLLWHIHIADSNRRAPGRGHLDLGNIIDSLNRMGYQGYLSAELLPLPDPDSAARETIRYLSQFL